MDQYSLEPKRLLVLPLATGVTLSLICEMGSWTNACEALSGKPGMG